eukprot:gene8128-8998_t
MDEGQLDISLRPRLAFDYGAKQEIEVLREKKKLATRRLKQLLKQKSQLSALNDSLSDKLVQKTVQFEKLKENCCGITNVASNDTEKVVSSLENLNQVIQDLLIIHSTEADGNEDDGMFPSKLSPADYFKAEENFTSSLTAYTKRQFFEGIAEMAGARDKLRYEIMEVNNPERLLIKGDSEETMKAKCKDLSRLQSVYTRSQTHRFESHCNLRKVQACLYKIEDNLSKIAVEPPALDTELLSSRVAKLQKQCAEEGREWKRIFHDELVPLIEELSELQPKKILSGNFDLKIARQNYFISKQDMVIDQLLLQNSRYELLSLLYEIEAKVHRESYHLLSAAKSFLNEEANGLEERLTEMSNLAQVKPPKETLDSRDTFMQNIYKAIGEDDATRSQQKHYITCEMLKGSFEKFIAEKKHSLDSLHKANQTDAIDCLHRKLQSCFVYIQNTKHPDDSKISEDISKIEDLLHTLEKSVKGIITDIDRKKKVLATDSLKALDRTIFPNFFNDPSRLQRIMSELKTRVEAVRQ